MTVLDLLLGRCDYREFRPHPCGKLIADLVDELATVPTIAVHLEDWESLCRTINEYFQVQGVCVTRQSGVGSAGVLRRLDQREAAFPLQEGKRRCKWLKSG
jgi:hypothetical protein